jgi:hypothetical protein
VKTVLFTYESPVGTFWIRPEPADRVLLGIDRRKLKTYGSAKAAARAVAERMTGWEAWDSLEGVVPPSRLERWKRPPR